MIATFDSRQVQEALVDWFERRYGIGMEVRSIQIYGMGATPSVAIVYDRKNLWQKETA